MRSVLGLTNISIETDGQRLLPEIQSTLAEVRIQQRLSQPSLCELTFFDPGGSLGTSAILGPGTALRVSVQGGVPDLFQGEVTAVEHAYGSELGHEVRVRGYDLLHRLRQRQPVRAHVDMTTTELARALTTEFGWQVQAQEEGPLWKRIIQYAQTDLELLSDTAARSGLFFTLRERTLVLCSLHGFGEALPLTVGAGLREARLEINAQRPCRSVLALGWDPLRIEAHSGRVDTPRSARFQGGLRGEAFAAGRDLTLTDVSVQDDRQAEGLAQGQLDLRSASEATLWALAEGDPQLRPGTVLDIGGVAPTLAGRYTLTSVNHSIDSERGFVSEVSSVPPPSRSTRAGTTLVLWGLVSQVEDPERLGRIQATLPAIGDVPTDWMNVLSAGAGADKGLVAIPEVGDSVLVLCVNGDPAQGVVLGGLYGGRGLPGAPLEAGARRPFSFISPGGQLLRFDDESKSLRLQSGNGSFLDLSPGKVLLHATAGLEIEAPGQTVIIRGGQIDFQRG